MAWHPLVPAIKKRHGGPNPIEEFGLPCLSAVFGRFTDRQARTSLETWWGDLGEKMTVIGTYSLIYNSQLLASQGWAYVITFDHLVGGPAGPDLVFRPLSPALRETTDLIWKKNVEQSPAARVFLRAMTAELQRTETAAEVTKPMKSTGGERR